MPLTRAAAETILTRRLGTRMTAAGLDGTTHDGTNVVLGDALWSALTLLGYAVADISTVADADLAPVTDTLRLMDVAELRTLEAIQGNLTSVSFRSAGGSSFDLSDLSDQVDRMIAKKQQYLRDTYGIGLGTLAGGVLGLAFQATLPEG